MRELTERQRECLSVIKTSIARRGYPPTLREIGDAMRITSTNGVNDHLRALERKRVIHRIDQKSRAIRLLDAARDDSDRTHDPRPPTPGQFIQRKGCLVCGAHTFGPRCPYCPAALLEVS